MSEFVLPTFEECRAAYVDRQDASALQCFIFLHSPILHKPEFTAAWREMLGDVIDEVIYEAVNEEADRDDPNDCAECARSNGPHYRGKCEHEGIQIKENNHYA